MRAFAWFLGALLFAGLIGALLAYPAYEFTSTFASLAFHRVASRIAMLVLVAELVWLCRAPAAHRQARFRLRPAVAPILDDLHCCGQRSAWPPPAWAPPFCCSTHLRVGAPDFIPAAPASRAFSWSAWLPASASRCIEETVLRGAMHTAIERESGPWTAALLTAPLFAVLHFFAKVRIAPTDVGWGSGFDLLLRSFAPLAHPALVFDSFLSWLIVGLILSLTRVLTGNIAVAIGLHAGWVIVLRMLQEATSSGSGAGLLPFGSADSTDCWATGCCRGALRHRRGALVHSRSRGCRRRERAEDVQPLDRIVELQTELLFGERDRQNLGETMSDPGRIVQAHLDARVDLAQLRQHGFQQLAPAARDAPAPAPSVPAPSCSTSARLRPSAWRLRLRIRKRCSPTHDSPSKPSDS